MSVVDIVATCVGSFALGGLVSLVWRRAPQPPASPPRPERPPFEDVASLREQYAHRVKTARACERQSLEPSRPEHLDTPTLIALADRYRAEATDILRRIVEVQTADEDDNDGMTLH